MKTLAKLTRAIITFIVVFALCRMATQAERANNVKAMEEYCQLVALHHDDPSVGWPDYRHIYKEQCTPEGGLQPEFYE